MLLPVGSVILVTQIPFQVTAALPKGETIHELEIIYRESTIRNRVRLGAGPR
jgi:hypothetical protein